MLSRHGREALEPRRSRVGGPAHSDRFILVGQGGRGRRGPLQDGSEVIGALRTSNSLRGPMLAPWGGWAPSTRGNREICCDWALGRTAWAPRTCCAWALGRLVWAPPAMAEWPAVGPWGICAPLKAEFAGARVALLPPGQMLSSSPCLWGAMALPSAGEVWTMACQ